MPVLKRTFLLGLLLVFASCSTTKINTQTRIDKIAYPNWFLNPYLASDPIISGYVSPGFYKDSSAALAYQTALYNAIRFQSADISANDAFWSTEAGVYWISADFQETIDSSKFRNFQSMFSPADTFFSKNLVIVGIAKNTPFSQPVKSRRLMQPQKPAWIETLPREPGYHYAIGVSPKYAYEKSSWDKATDQVRKQLAVSLSVEIKAMQKRSEFEGEEQREQTSTIQLNGFEIRKRWFDAKANLFYVLGRIPEPR